MKKILQIIQSNILKGFLAIIPIALSLLAVQFLFNVIDKKILNLLESHIGYRLPGLGILLVLMILFIIGFLTSSILGRQIFLLIEGVFRRLPLVKTTYEFGKQFSQTLSQDEKALFKKAVLVDYLRSGAWILGFVMGETSDARRGKKLVKVFLPTVPTPFGGVLIWVEEELILDPGWPIDEAMKAIVSCGVIGGEEIR